MVVERQDHVMYKDSHDELAFVVEDVPSLIGARMSWKLAEKLTLEVVLTKSSLNPGEISYEGNSFTVHITPSDLADVEPGYYLQEARVTDPEGLTRPVSKGKVYLRQPITTGSI